MPFDFSPLLNRLPGFMRKYLLRVRDTPLGKRMAGGVIWSTGGAAFSRVLALAASIVTARLLGKQVFGEFGIVQSTVNMFATFATFGMGLTATRHVAEYRVADPPRAGRIIGMSSTIAWCTGLIMVVVVYFAAPALAAKSLGAPHLAGILRISAVLLLFTVVNEAQIGSLSGLEAFRRRSMIQSAASLVGFPVSLVGVYFWGLAGTVWGLAVAQGILVFLNARGVSQEARLAGIAISWKVSRRELKVLWEFSVPTLLGSVVYIPAIWFANAIIVNYPNGYAEMGIFSAADRWRTAIMFLPSLLGGVALPMLSNLRAAADFEKYHHVLWTNVKLSFLFSLAASIPIMLGSYWIMAAYGSGFSGGRWILVGLCVVAVISATSWILVQSLVSDGRMWLLLVLNFIWAVLLVSTCWFLRSYGAAALVTAYLLAESTRLILMFLMTRSKSAGMAGRPAKA